MLTNANIEGLDNEKSACFSLGPKVNTGARRRCIKRPSLCAGRTGSVAKVLMTKVIHIDRVPHHRALCNHSRKLTPVNLALQGGVMGVFRK